MTLEQWTALSAAERNQKRRRWRSDRGYWISLLEEAHRRFKEEFGGHPFVSDVRFTLRYGEGQEPEIHVTTALWSPQIIEELPDRYHTFRVIQTPNEDRRRRYLTYWTTVLWKTMRWRRSRVIKWARKHDDDVRGIGAYAHHYEPVDYVVAALIPERMRLQLSVVKLHELEARLEQALQLWDSKKASFGYHPELPGYDWVAAKKRIRRILLDYRS